MGELRQESRFCGCAVWAAAGDALGMPLEFGPPQPADQLVREMQSSRLPAGTFTDDTEMALALAEGLLTAHSFEEAVIQVVNLGNDADSAGTVVGTLAGAAYGLEAIPQRRRDALRGELTWQRGRIWRTEDLAELASQLAGCAMAQSEANG